MIRLRLPQLPDALLGLVAPPAGGPCPRVEDCLPSGALMLEMAGIQTARLDAECLLAHALGCPRWRLIIEPRRRLTRNEFGRYLGLLHRRELREPLAYLVGRREFWSLTLAVSPAVLVPRPETETLVETALEILCGRDASPQPARADSCPPTPDGSHPVVVDLCTGSGAVAIAIARDLPGAAVYATDISRQALRLAHDNARAQGVSDRITFLRGDLWRALDGLGQSLQADLIVANPPYIPSDTIATLMPEVQWEPRRALDGGPDGLRCSRAILAEAPAHLRPGGSLLLEIGCDQAASVTRLAAESGAFGTLRVVRDLAGRDRVVVAPRLPGAAA